jgi:hypothetical protein
MFSRTVRVSAVAAAAVLTVGGLGTSAADAKPPTTPGGVTGLAATVTPGSGSYDVTSTWNAASNAVKYRVTLKKGATTLSTDTVTTTSWHVAVSTTPGSASLSVQPVAAKKPGPTTTIPVNLPDVTAPTATYESSWNNNTGVGTITQDSLTDDSGTANVTRTVDWGDGSAPQTWTSGTTITHAFPLTLHGYSPTVTLRDAANNQAVINVPAIVIMDTTAPTGTFTVTPGSAWATLTSVTLTQTGLSDNWSEPQNITRSVDWGDGTAPESWPNGDTLTHVYSAAGDFVPQVRITDEAHNAAVVPTSGVTVDQDVQAPTGSFSVAPGTAWSAFTTVTLTQQGVLADNVSPADKITRSVDWGDGTKTDWTSADPLTHVYAVAGKYTPTVALTDQVGNVAHIPTGSAVTVTKDAIAPTIKLVLPAKAKSHSVRAWKTLRGKAIDAQTGVAKVSLRAVEKRGRAWYGYNATTKKWVKTRTEAKAFSRAKPFALTTDARNRWSASLVRLTKGTLVYRVQAADHVGNVKKVVHQAALTRR